jgi:hypothetical protein
MAKGHMKNVGNRGIRRIKTLGVFFLKQLPFSLGFA